ncbi:MAG: dihydrodipicolinate synthase family protein [Desulfobacterales bacterium]|nr:dihydrodipicolinate synthase family protein [Desulfobacterales bacterium]
MITPFNKQGDLNLADLTRLVEFLSQYVQGLFICGSYGSGPMMSIEERKKVAETTVDVAAGKLKVVVHTGTTNTRDTLELSKHAKEIGCDAVAAVGPYYYNHGEDDLLYFYSDIIRAVGTDFPVYIYHNPKFQGYDIDISTIHKLKEIGLRGIKDATFDILSHASYLRELAGDDFDIVLGTEAMWLSARALGCEAFIPGIGNTFPELCVKMWEEGMKNDFDACRKTQFLINEMRKLMYIARSTQQAVYCMASLRGIIEAYPRAPFVPTTDNEKSTIKTALNKLGVL